MDTEHIDKMIRFFEKAKLADSIIWDIICADQIDFVLAEDIRKKIEKYQEE